MMHFLMKDADAPDRSWRPGKGTAAPRKRRVSATGSWCSEGFGGQVASPCPGFVAGAGKTACWLGVYPARRDRLFAPVSAEMRDAAGANWGAAATAFLKVCPPGVTL
jgi:hypothetical protein